MSSNENYYTWEPQSDFFPYEYKLCIQIYHYGELPKIEMREMKYLKKS